VRFSHRLVNTGNGADQYALQLTNLGGDNFDLLSLAVYADVNRDGLADSTSPITTTPLIGAGNDYHVVVEATLPGALSGTDSAQVRLLAISNFASTLSQFNTDTVVVDNGATVRLRKSISANSGLSPSGPYTVTLSYENTGAVDAVDVTLIDSLPAGMSYVPGSGRWHASSAALTDANPNDVHTGGSAQLRYCAYDSSCLGLAEAQADADSASTNQVTAIVNRVAAGESGTLSFDIDIDDLLTAGALINQAELEYASGGTVVPREFSNAVSFTVLPTAGVVANGSVATSINSMNEPVNVLSAAPGGIVLFDNIVWNTGNTTDSFNIEVDAAGSTFPAGTSYRLLQSDAATPLLDTNTDGIVDTGPIAPGQFVKVVLRLDLLANAAGNNGGLGFDLTKTARSITDGGVFDSVTDHLDEIVANQVDLTNQAAAGASGALGVGPGPEANPVSTLILSNRSAVFDLYVRHQGSSPDTYRLRAMGSAAGTPLPAGWAVEFTDATTGATLTNTGPLASGSSRHVLATVTTPADLSPGTISLFFAAESALTGASDIKHDAVQVGVDTTLQLQPSLSAQLEPGGSVVYEHVITNRGNIAVSDIEFTVAQSRPGWTAALHEDTNPDGFLGPGDQVITGTLSLLPGESRDVFLKVYAPADAVTLQRNRSTLTATWNAGSDSLTITDISTINRTHVHILKEQAVDTGCDGVPDVGSVFGPGEIEVAPGNNCVVYRLTATNRGLEPSFNVTIHDHTPSYTRYHPSAICSRTPCWINEPAANNTGVVKAETDQLLPGDTFFLQFSVQVY